MSNFFTQQQQQQQDPNQQPGGGNPAQGQPVYVYAYQVAPQSGQQPQSQTVHIDANNNMYYAHTPSTQPIDLAGTTQLVQLHSTGQQPNQQQGFVIQQHTPGVGTPPYQPGTPSSLPRYSLLQHQGTPPSASASGPGAGHSSLTTLNTLDTMDEDTASMLATPPAPKVQEGFFPTSHTSSSNPNTPTVESSGMSALLGSAPPSTIPSALLPAAARAINVPGSKPIATGAGGAGGPSLLKHAQMTAAGAAGGSPALHTMSLPSGLGGMDWMSSVGSPLATSFDQSSSYHQPQSPAPGAGGPMLASSFQAASSVPVPLQVGTPTTPGFMQIGSQASSLPFSMTGSPIMSTFFEGDELDPSSKPMQVIFEKRRRRRESHNAVERRRRDNINERIAELGLLLPEYYVGSDPNVKPNKGQILRKVVDYVRHVQQTLKEAMDRQNELEGALRNLGVNPPQSELGHTMKALLTLPQHSIAALAQLAQQQQHHHQQQQAQSSQGAQGDGSNDGQQQSMSPGAHVAQHGEAGLPSAGSQPGTPLGGQMVQSPVSTAGGEHPMNMSMSPTVMQQSFGFQQRQHQQQQQQQQQPQQSDYMDHSGAGGGGNTSGQHSPQFAQGQQGQQQQGPQQQVMVMYPNGMGGIVPLQGHGLVTVLPPQTQQRT